MGTFTINFISITLFSLERHCSRDDKFDYKNESNTEKKTELKELSC